MNCHNCGTPIKGRKDKKYCGQLCKGQAFARMRKEKDPNYRTLAGGRESQAKISPLLKGSYKYIPTIAADQMWANTQELIWKDLKYQ